VGCSMKKDLSIAVGDDVCAEELLLIEDIAELAIITAPVVKSIGNTAVILSI